MANSFRDLVVWQRGMQLTLAVYKLTREFPREELFGLTGQMRRAAFSVPCNIAEGHSRLNTAEFRQFLGIARGSNAELQTQLELSKALGYATSDAIRTAEKLSSEVGKMLYAMINSTRRKPGTKAPVL